MSLHEQLVATGLEGREHQRRERPVGDRTAYDGDVLQVVVLVHRGTERPAHREVHWEVLTMGHRP